jgi:hypothetical protein
MSGVVHASTRGRMAVTSPVRTTLFALLLLPWAPLLFAQTPEQRIEDALQRAQAAGIPTALLESKVAEGRAKRVPLERVAAAVELRLATLQQVQTEMRAAQLDEPELGIAADAVQAGISTGVLMRLADTRRDRRAAALETLSQLVQLGYPVEEAHRRVAEALRGPPDALMNLPAQAAAARARTPPGAAKKSVTPPGGGGPAASRGRGGPPPTVPPRGKPDPPGRGRGG